MPNQQSDARGTDGNAAEDVNRSSAGAVVVPTAGVPIGSTTDEQLGEEEVAAQLGDFA